MAKPYKLTPIDLALPRKGQFEDNLDKLINNETFLNNENLLGLLKYNTMLDHSDSTISP